MRARKRDTRSSSSCVDLIVEELAWKKTDPDLEVRMRQAVAVAVRQAPHESSASVVAILLTDDDRLRKLNRQHRGKDKPTNVLSFGAAQGTDHLGDIAIAYGTAKREAEASGKPLVHHVLHLAVHGVLHLLGYDHENPAEAERMENLEAQILGEMGIPDPYEQDGCAA